MKTPKKEELHLGSVFKNAHGMKFICVGVFDSLYDPDDVTVYGDFKGNESDVWEFNLDEIELCEKE